MVYGWLNFVHGLLFPPHCVLCGQSGQPPLRDLCAGCESELPWNQPACIRCAQPLTGDGLSCGRCLRRPPDYHASHCALRYAFPVDHLVRGLKYGDRIAHGRVLAELLAQSLIDFRKGPWPDCIVPVPLASRRYCERGYNQAIELGHRLERVLHVPLRTDLVERFRHTAEQASLDARQRRKNVRGVFRVRGAVAGLHAAILDDVVTTGSTVNELARALSRAGARHIEVWAVARAPR